MEWVLPLVSLLVGLVSGAGGAYAASKIIHVRNEERYSALSGHVADIWQEIGDRKSGIRGQLHKHHNWLGKHASRLLRLEEKVGIPPWDDRDDKE